MARFTFFVGKGGVGKTTVSSAYALHRAANYADGKILLLSTDPAHSTADVLQTALSDSAKRLRAAGQVWARQLSAEREIKRFLARERRDVLALLNKGTLFAGDELEPLLDTSLPGMAEVAALLAVDELLASDYDEIVVDTAPMGHAIRLFEMPEHFARFLNVLETAAARDVTLAQHFGGRVRREPALDRWTQMVQRVKEALSKTGSKIVMVTTPEPFSLQEAARSASAFHVEGRALPIPEIVLNRVVATATKCPQCTREVMQSRAARKFLRAHFPKAKVFTAEDPGCPILGVGALHAFGKHVFAGAKLPRSIRIHAAKAEPIQLDGAAWPTLATPLTLTLGKGGVGKTTISASLAFHHRRTVKGEPVTICSVDPAPSLSDVFATQIGSTRRAVLGDRKLLAVELDAKAEFRQWAASMRQQLTDATTSENSGLHVDLSADRSFLLALLDVVPPGVDEIFAVFRILDLLRRGGRVIIDMAPTGHALEVLRTPERVLAWTRVLLKTLAAHRGLPMARDAAVELATLSQNVREVAEVLRDRSRCAVVVVTLPEPLPDRETERLRSALATLEAPLASVFINRVLLPVPRSCPRCKLRGEWQALSLAKLGRQLRDTEAYIAREFGTPITGSKGLREFTSELWRLRTSAPQRKAKRQQATE